ncbi:hypothetical protein KAI87_12510 [Myxococcota bacterium]|nr:hypothetical protein [Myxococcota bacterium]
MKPRKTMANRLWKIATVVMILLSVFYLIYELKSIVYDVFIGPTMDHMVKDLEEYTPQLVADYKLISESSEKWTNTESKKGEDAGPHLNYRLRWIISREGEEDEEIAPDENYLSSELCEQLVHVEDKWLSLPPSVIESIPKSKLMWLDSVTDFSSWNIFEDSPIENSLRESDSIPFGVERPHPRPHYLRCVIRARMLVARRDGELESVVRQSRHLAALVQHSSYALLMLPARHLEEDIAQIGGGTAPAEYLRDPFYRSILPSMTLFAPIVLRPLHARRELWQAAPRTHFCAGLETQMDRLAAWRPMFSHSDPELYRELDQVFETPGYCPFSVSHKEMWFKWKELGFWPLPWPSIYHFIPEEISDYERLPIRWFPPLRQIILDIYIVIAEPGTLGIYKRVNLKSE